MSQFTTDRRTIVKGAAWAVPAVSVAAAAPTLAASPEPQPDIDLSTSASAGGTRTANNLNLNPSTFNNTGTETVQGLTITFVASGDQTITGIKVFGTDIKELVAGATTSGYGSNTVVLTLPPGTGLGQVTIAPGGSYKAPLGQDIGLGSTEAFTLSVTVKATNATDDSVPFETSQEIEAG